MSKDIRLKKVWQSDGTCFSGNLRFQNGPIIELDIGEILESHKKGITYEIEHEIVIGVGNSVSKEVNLKKPVRIHLEPLFMTRKRYSPNEIEDRQDIYPPSSGGWVGRMLRGKEEAEYIVQRIDGSNEKWLTISNPKTEHIWESHAIKPYEIEILRMKTSFEYFKELGIGLTTMPMDDTRKYVMDILDEENLTWPEVLRLTGGIVSPSFTIDGTVRDMLQKLVPIEQFQIAHREQILAFLAWAAKKIIPDGDITEFVRNIQFLPAFGGLIGEHFKFLMEGIDSPAYVEIIRKIMLEREFHTKEGLEEQSEKHLEHVLIQKLIHIAPDWLDNIVEIAKNLSSSKEIVTSYPIHKGKSISSQKERFIINQWGLRIRADVRYQKLGLRQICYIGAAHRYPHRHLVSSLRLGPLHESAPYLQEMIMPVGSAKSVKRFLPSVLDIKYDIWNLNLDLFNRKQNKWITDTTSILDSLEDSISLKQIGKEFGFSSVNSVYLPKQEEAKILDMSSLHFYLTDLSTSAGRAYWKTDKTETKRILTRLRNNDVIKISYWFLLRTTVTGIAMMIQGPSGSVCSLSRSFAMFSPSARVRISNDGKTALLISRVSPDSIDVLNDALPPAAEEVGISIKRMFPTVFRNYSRDLYQRLLCDNGKWDDDISDFLSQIRSHQN